MDANSKMELVEPLWDINSIEARARELLDVGVWSAAEDEDRGSGALGADSEERSVEKDVEGYPTLEARYRKPRASVEPPEAERTEADSLV